MISTDDLFYQINMDGDILPSAATIYIYIFVCVVGVYVCMRCVCGTKVGRDSKFPFG